MQGNAWIHLFKRIPAEQQNCLVVMTTNGTELVLQRLIRLEDDFVAAIGRVSGSTDQGRVVVIPYDQLTYLSINKQMDDAEVQALLGVQTAHAPAAMDSRQRAAPAPRMETPAGENKPATEPRPSAASASSSTDTPSQAANGDLTAAQKGLKGSPPSKAILLARLRQRLADDAAKFPKA